MQVIIKDASFKSISRQRPVENPTWLAADLTAQSLKIIKDAWKICVPIRMLTITGAAAAARLLGMLCQ